MLTETHETLDRAQRQEVIERDYAGLLCAYPEGIRLSSLLELSRIAPGFTPHPDGAVTCAKVQEFAERHGIWRGPSPGMEKLGEHIVSMTPYLNRGAISEQRLTLAAKAYHIDFYLDDMFGSEHQKRFLPAEKIECARTVRDLLEVLEGKKEASTGLELAAAEVFADLHRLCTPDLVEQLLAVLRPHIESNAENLDTGAIGTALDVDSYIEKRNDVSGMIGTIWFIQFTSDNFLTSEELASASVASAVDRLRFLCAVIDGTGNDFFSFEKEVIDARDDFNLIPVVMANDPPLSLEAAIQCAAEIVNRYTREFLALASWIRQACQASPLRDRIHEHVDALTDAVAATWHWEIYTGRYSRPHSLWAETRVVTEPVPQIAYSPLASSNEFA